MTWSHFITFLSVVGFLVTAAGLVGVSFKVGRNAQTVSNYRDSADAWEKKSHSQAEEIAELKAKLSANEATSNKLQDRVQILEELVTGKATFTNLVASIDANFSRLEAHLDAAVQKIHDDIRGKYA